MNTAVFDIIGTCFSLELPRQELLELGAPSDAVQLWFAQTLRDAFALSHAGSYQPLKEILKAELPRTLKILGVETTKEQRSQVLSTMSKLELQPEAKEAFQIFASAGWKLVALTNGSEDSTRNLLAQSDSIKYFSDLYSCDTVQKTKPHPEVYALPKQDEDGALWMIAVHAWDIAGAALAGYKTTFVAQQEKEYLSIYPQPTMIANNLVEAATMMTAS